MTQIVSQSLPVVSGALIPGHVITLSVVMPVHNEEEIIRTTVQTVCESIAAMEEVVLSELILSENGSVDATLEIATELAEADPRIKVLSLALPDYGAAMKAAFVVASGEVIINFDADYFDFDFLRSALSLEADVVIAAKNIHGSVDDRTALRRNVSRLFGWLVRTSLGIRSTETHGIKLYRREAIEAVLPLVESTKDLFDTELVARAELLGLRVTELPITTREMRASRSGIVRRIPRTVLGLLRLRRRLRCASGEPEMAHHLQRVAGRSRLI